VIGLQALLQHHRRLLERERLINREKRQLEALRVVAKRFECLRREWR
jgi:hypothetical protein